MEIVLLLANGFLPTRGSWMLDFVSVVMFFVVATMAYSIYQVRVGKNKKMHRMIQIVTAFALTAALILFEIDMRFFTDWRECARLSPHYDSGVVDWSLVIHLIFAIPSPFVWGFVIVLATKRFRNGFEQGEFNRFHRISGRIAAAMMLATAVTGWVFYCLAFVA